MTDWYWLFGGQQFYASGGMNDLIGMYPTLVAAKVAATEAMQSDQAYPEPRVEWWHIVDTRSGVVVMRSECKPYGGE